MKQHFCRCCGKELLGRNKRNNIYCDIHCQQEYQYQQYINKWKLGLENGMCGEYSISKHIKKYLFKKYNNKCSRCGWGEINPYTNSIPLEVEHIDGNYMNNKENNLTLLCPNCHSLTATYKGANIGKGRQTRHKYYNK